MKYRSGIACYDILMRPLLKYRPGRRADALSSHSFWLNIFTNSKDIYWKTIRHFTDFGLQRKKCKRLAITGLFLGKKCTFCRQETFFFKFYQSCCQNRTIRKVTVVTVNLILTCAARSRTPIKNDVVKYIYKRYCELFLYIRYYFVIRK